MSKKISIKGIREVARKSKNIEPNFREFAIILYDKENQEVYFSGVWANDYRFSAFSKTDCQEYRIYRPMTMKEIRFMILGEY